MELALDLQTIVQAVFIVFIGGYIKTNRDLVTVVKLHEWRIKKLEESKTQCKAVKPA